MRTCVTARPSSRLFTSGFTVFSRHSTSSAARPPAGGPPVSSPLRPRLEAVGVRKAMRSGTSTATVAHSVLDPFVLSVKTLGKQVKSGQTGFLVRLPGTEIAKIEVTQNFGDSPETEGSLVKVISGSLGKHDPNKLVIEEIK